MSNWTYVQGLIELDVPGRTQAEKNYILQTVIDHLPKVTGSEKPINEWICYIITMVRLSQTSISWRKKIKHDQATSSMGVLE